MIIVLLISYAFNNYKTTKEELIKIYQSSSFWAWIIPTLSFGELL